MLSVTAWEIWAFRERISIRFQQWTCQSQILGKMDNDHIWMFDKTGDSYIQIITIWLSQWPGLSVVYVCYIYCLTKASRNPLYGLLQPLLIPFVLFDRVLLWIFILDCYSLRFMMTFWSLLINFWSYLLSGSMTEVDFPSGISSLIFKKILSFVNYRKIAKRPANLSTYKLPSIKLNCEHCIQRVWRLKFREHAKVKFWVPDGCKIWRNGLENEMCHNPFMLRQ